MTTSEGGLAPCVNCGRARRPIRSSATDYPGTVRAVGGGSCSTCYGKQYQRQGAKRRAVSSISETCVRCGLVRKGGGNLRPLCRDCRDVLSVQEREKWETAA